MSEAVETSHAPVFRARRVLPDLNRYVILESGGSKGESDVNEGFRRGFAVP
jgi:hypothetical protein